MSKVADVNAEPAEKVEDEGPTDREKEMGADKKIEAGGEDDPSNLEANITKRYMTDKICCLAFVVHWILLIILCGMAIGDGNPGRLTSSQDIFGNFCGLAGETMVMDGETIEMAKYPYVYYALNTDEAMIKIVKAVIPAESNGDGGGNDFGAAAADMQAASEDPAGGMLKMMQSQGGGANSLLNEMTKYFVPVCVKACPAWDDESSKEVFGTDADGAIPKRSYEYDTPKKFIEYQKNFHLLPTGMKTSFTMPAMEKSFCPYGAKYCVPLAGLEVEQMGNFCVPKMLAAAAAGAADAAAAASDAIPAGFSDGASAGADAFVADIQVSVDVIFMSMVLAMIIGVAFIVLLRFIIKPVAWTAVILIAVCFFAGGAMMLTKSTACIDGEVHPDWEPESEGTTPDPGTTPYPGYEMEELAVQEIPYCLKGYEIKAEASRSATRVGGIILLICGGIYVIIVICMLPTIRLAIAINEVAAKFVMQNAMIITLPACQIVGSIAFWAVWCTFTMYIVSYVPASIIPDLADPDICPTRDVEGGYPGCLAYETEEIILTEDEVGVMQSMFSGVAVGDPYTQHTYHGDEDACKDGAPRQPDSVCEGLKVTPADESRKICCMAINCEEPPYFIDDEDNSYKCRPPRTNMGQQFWFTLFALFWNNNMNVALGQMVIAGSVALWYFCPNEDKGKAAPGGKRIKLAGWVACRFHLGSMAFGAFILACIQLLRAYLKFLAWQAKRAKNPIAVKIAMIIDYYVACFEKFVKFLNKNAYIQCAMTGKPFCASAWAAFCLILRNMGRIGVLKSLGAITHRLGKYCIMCATVFVSYQILMFIHKEDITSPVGPVFFFFIVGMVVGDMTMSVFGLAVDTVLQCFIADVEMDPPLDDKGVSKYTPPELNAHLNRKPASKSKCCIL